MIKLRLPKGIRSCFVPAVLLLLVGLVLDFGFTRPRVTEVRALCARRAALSAQLSELSAREWAADRICVRLGCTNAEDSLAASGSDLAELARKIDAAGLRRLEIVARESGREGNVLIAHFTVRVTGSYQQNLEFVRSLEADPRLMVLESFRLEPIVGSSALDAAYDLRLIDPITVEGVAS
jgi:hypothetical protein